MTALHDIFSRTADAVFATDRSHRIIYQNRIFTEIFPHGSSAPPQRKCYEVLCGRTLDGNEFCNSDCPIGRSVVQGQSVENFNLSVPRDDGEPVQVNVGAMPVSRVFDDVAAIFMLRPIGAFGNSSRPAENAKRTDVMAHEVRQALTRRERQILDLLARGLESKALAYTLHISHVTARNHIQHIYAKLGVHNRAEAVSYGFRNGLLR